MRKIMLAALATAVLALAVAPRTYASVSGSQGFDSATLTQADALPTGNINTATVFQLDDWKTNGNSTGLFTGLSAQDFGMVTLTLGKGTGLMFGNSSFGVFDSTTITASSTGPGFLDVLAVGTFSPGSIFPGAPAATSETRIALTQTPPGDGSISASGTMSITPTTVVPEDATFFLFGTGLLTMLGLLSVPKFRQKLYSQIR
jgi:hypothetical protein